MTAISDATIDSTEFNLLIEPWIKVLRDDGSTDELSCWKFSEADKLIPCRGNEPDISADCSWLFYMRFLVNKKMVCMFL